MFKNMKLGTKIAFGFGVLIFIAVLLGSIAVYNMQKVKKESVILANEYIPEVIIATDLRGAANRLMYAVRGYAFSGEKIYYDQGLNEVKEIDSLLVKAEELDKKAESLKLLKKQIEEARVHLSDYKDLFDKTREADLAIASHRNTLAEIGNQILNNFSLYLEGQIKKANEEAENRSTGKEELGTILKKELKRLMRQMLLLIYTMIQDSRFTSFRFLKKTAI